MKHEERHAVGMWLVAALLGGFAVFAWATGRLGNPREELQPPVEVEDTARVAATPPTQQGYLASPAR